MPAQYSYMPGIEIDIKLIQELLPIDTIVTKKKGLTKFHKDHVISSQSIMHHTYLNLYFNYESSYNNQNHSSPMQY
jgi:hypothetical protein